MIGRWCRACLRAGPVLTVESSATFSLDDVSIKLATMRSKYEQVYL
jgi:hypothetical protein